MTSLIRVVAAAALLLGAAQAQELDVRPVTESLTSEDIARVLTQAGLSPTMLEDATGAPVATGSSDGIIFVVRAVDCEGQPARCGQLVLFANFDLGRPIGDQDFRIVNGFNDGNKNGRAYVLENRSQIGVDYIIDLTGGVTSEHIENRLNRWPDIIGTFQQQMNAAYTGS
ncbi:MAG: YbjN domain-containing protein [Pseudomonadota bacterium]